MDRLLAFGYVARSDKRRHMTLRGAASESFALTGKFLLDMLHSASSKPKAGQHPAPAVFPVAGLGEFPFVSIQIVVWIGEVRDAPQEGSLRCPFFPKFSRAIGPSSGTTSLRVPGNHVFVHAVRDGSGGLFV